MSKIEAVAELLALADLHFPSSKARAEIVLELIERVQSGEPINAATEVTKRNWELT